MFRNFDFIHIYHANVDALASELRPIAGPSRTANKGEQMKSR